MPTPHKTLLITVLSTLLYGAAQAASNLTLLSAQNNTESRAETASGMADESEKTLTVQARIFDIPLLTYDDISKETLELAKNSLTQMLDSDGDGQPDNPELASFMAQNGYQLVIANKGKELEELDEDIYSEEKTALISTQGVHADSHISETLRVIAKAHLAHLNQLSEKGYTSASGELEAFTTATDKLKKQGFSVELGDDNETDMALVIVASEMVLAGQFQRFIDRLLEIINTGLEKIAERDGRTLQPEEKFSLDDQMSYYKTWYESTAESFRKTAPEMCDWLARNKLTSTSWQIPETAIDLDEEVLRELYLSDPFDDDEEGNDEDDEDEEDESEDENLQKTVG